MKAGFIAILGRPNVGKSSLINALVGEKVSIVSPKAQTTRDRILGILTGEDYQMVFVDTPGVHQPKSKLGEYMSGAVSSSVKNADAVVIVLDASKPYTGRDESFILKHLTPSSPPLYLAVNKTDLGGFGVVYPLLSKLSPLTDEAEGRQAVKEIIPLSAKKRDNLEPLLNCLLMELPEGEKLFPDDEYTDKSMRFIVSETIREKALLYLQDEIPHGVGVVLQTYEEKARAVVITADIICEKQSHKPIIIGEGGAMLKKIGSAARTELERRIEKSVNLELFVKVREGWRDRPSVMDDIGYKK